MSDESNLLLQELQEKFNICSKEKDEYLDGWQRARADLANQANRHIQEKSEVGERMFVEIISNFLPLFDSLEAGNTHKVADIGPMYQQYLSLLEKMNISKIFQLGEMFDPAKHQSIQTKPVANVEEDNTVVEILQIGYTKGKNVIRPALVSVGHYQKEN
jgi:molecular chaperone GrpE